MSFKKIFYPVLFLLIIISCGKDDEPTDPPVAENNAPTIAAQTLPVAENLAPGSKIGDISASDEDNDALSFTLSGDSPFVLSKEGSLSLGEGQNLDFETTKTYSLNVSVSDGTATVSATVTVNVTNVNEPPVFGEISFNFMPNEDITTEDIIGTVMAEDPEGDEIAFSISENDNDLFAIDATSGEIRLAEEQTLDFDTMPDGHSIVVTADDQNGETATTNVGIGLTDVDEAPAFDEGEYNFTADENISDAEVIGTVSATDPDGDEVEFSIAENDNGLFTINATTGEIRLAEGQSLDFEESEAHT